MIGNRVGWNAIASVCLESNSGVRGARNAPQCRGSRVDPPGLIHGTAPLYTPSLSIPTGQFAEAYDGVE